LRAAAYDRDALLRAFASNEFSRSTTSRPGSVRQAGGHRCRRRRSTTSSGTDLPIVEEIHGNWTAALTVSYPAFDGFRTKAQVAQAESALKQTELRRGDIERTVTIEVESALSDLRTIKKKMEIEKLKIDQAQDALRIAEERFGSGLLSATDLVDAQNALESARLNALQLVYSHVLGEYNLFRACGRKL
jgi:outer membrane protein TolC